MSKVLDVGNSFLIIIGLTALCVGASLGLLWLTISISNQPTDAMDDFCVNKDHKKATDYIKIGELNETATRDIISFKIECDKKTIYQAYLKEECIQYNKWDVCERVNNKFYSEVPR